jgi:hypothetical protein
MTADPRVTVVVPTYRRPQLLVEAVGSILESSYTDFEVLVVNDGPAEDLVQARTLFRDSRIRWITRPTRLGMLENNLDAFRLARGEFIAHLDDDDRWAPSLLARLVPILDANHDVVVAFADHFIIDADGLVLGEQTLANSGHWGRATLTEGMHRPFGRLAVVDKSIPLQCAAVFRKSALGSIEYPPQVGCLWDLWTAYVLSRSGGSAWYVGDQLAFYRVHLERDTVTGRSANTASRAYCCERFLEDPALMPWAPTLRRRLSQAEIYLAMESLREGDSRDGRRRARRAVALDRSPLALSLALATHLAPNLAKTYIERRRAASNNHAALGTDAMQRATATAGF